jgi:hypothetical protein
VPLTVSDQHHAVYEIAGYGEVKTTDGAAHSWPAAWGPAAGITIRRPHSRTSKINPSQRWCQFRPRLFPTQRPEPYRSTFANKFIHLSEIVANWRRIAEDGLHRIAWRDVMSHDYRVKWFCNDMVTQDKKLTVMASLWPGIQSLCGCGCIVDSCMATRAQNSVQFEANVPKAVSCQEQRAWMLTSNNGKIHNDVDGSIVSIVFRWRFTWGSKPQC